MRSPCFRQPAAFSFLFPDPNVAAIDEVITPPSQNPDTRHKLSTGASSQTARPASTQHRPAVPKIKLPIRPHAPIDTPGQSATLEQLIVRRADSPFVSEPTHIKYPVRHRDATPLLFVWRTLQLFENAVKVAARVSFYFPETGVCLPTPHRVVHLLCFCCVIAAGFHSPEHFLFGKSTPVEASMENRSEPRIDAHERE